MHPFRQKPTEIGISSKRGWRLTSGGEELFAVDGALSRQRSPASLVANPDRPRKTSMLKTPFSQRHLTIIEKRGNGKPQERFPSPKFFPKRFISSIKAQLE